MSLLHSFYCWGSVGVILLSTVFFSVFGSPEDRKKTQEALSLLRKEIGAQLRGRLHLKRIPSFTFEYDDTPEKASRVEAIFQVIEKEHNHGK